ncbi:peroxiredoxin family protein [Hymenobacter oligotrophus]|nr:TlpA disulfide reductase family protein [Hymenobacter oligotrophus]
MKTVLLLLGALGWSIATPNGQPAYVLATEASVLAAGGSVETNWQTATALRVGSLAPDFRLQDLMGKAVAMQELRGKVVYLDFWFAGCKPCVAEAAPAAELRRKFAGQDVVFVYISTDIVVDDWVRAVRQHALDGPSTIHLLDPQGIRAARRYGVQGFPTYLIIGRDGRIRHLDAPRPSDGAQTISLLKQSLAAKR